MSPPERGPGAAPVSAAPRMPASLWGVSFGDAALAFLVLSGFLLRADADALQARRIFEQVVVLVTLLAAALAFVAWLPRLAQPAAVRARHGLVAATAGYVVLCALALFMRGENWTLRTDGPAWPDGPGDLQAGPALTRAGIDIGAATPR